MKYDASFTIENWEENKIREMQEPEKFNRGEVVRRHEGYVQGRETMHYTLFYADPARSEFTGIGLFEGRIGEESGNFVMIERGSFRNGGVNVEFEVRKAGNEVKLDTLIGRGRYQTSAHQRVPYEFETIN